MTEKEEIIISDEKTIAEIKSMRRQIKSAGIDTSNIEIVQMCIGLAKRQPKKWVVWID